MRHNLISKSLPESLFLFCVLTTTTVCLAVTTTQLHQNGSYHLNVTNCEERLKTVSPVFTQLLEMAACSRRAFMEVTFEPSADDAAEDVNVTDMYSMLISNTHLEGLFNNEFCNLPNLNQLMLRNNRFQDGDFLGLGNNCEPSTCGLQLQTLSLESNRLTSIRSNSFLCNMRNLTTLYLQNNRLEDIDVHAFRNASRLGHVYMTNNSLTHLDRGTFANLNTLWTLDVSFNKLKRIDCFGDGDDLSGLGNLDLNDNEIESLESGVFKGVANIVYLTLANNHVSNVADGTFDSLKRLENLHLEYNFIPRISRHALRGLDALVSLELNNNKISYIEPEAFQHVPRLSSLSLENNTLKAVPSFSRMEKLTQLALGRNLLETVANGSFQNLSRLESLDLSFNQIDVLEDNCFQNLVNMKTLKLDHNQLTYKEHLVSGYVSFFSGNATEAFRNLINLDLSYNEITEFRYYIPFYVNSSSLKRLNLSHNKLSMMKIYSHYEPILKLVVLDLSYNSIPELNSDRVFLTNLAESMEDIYLNDNKIRHVDPQFFRRVPALKSLKLSNNLLTSLDLSSAAFPGSIRGLVLLELAGNPWTCDCHLEWLKEVINNPTSNYLVQDYSRLICARQFHRFRNISVPLTQAIKGRDFMCSLDPTKETCLAHTQNVCLPSCPESCTCHRTSNWEEVIVDCHGMNLTAVPIENMSGATTSWYLDVSRIPELEDLPNLPFLTELFLNHTDLKSINVTAFSKVPSLQRLFLQDNMLEVLPHGIFDNLTHLVELNLAHNRLSELSLSLFLPLVSLDKLNLNDNNLREIPVGGLGVLSKLSSITLHNNPWSCDCSFVLDFTQWMFNESKKLTNSDQIYCLSDESGEKIYLNWFDESQCLNSTSPALNSEQFTPGLLISFMVAVTIILVLLMVIYFFRHDMQVLIYSRYGLRLFHTQNEDGDKGKLYDAFVSYSSLDEDFIVHHLLPGLEDIPRPYRICLHHRDFPIGAYINESIYQAIDQSCRTIIILSENFVKSEWCKFEFRTAHAQMLQDRQNRVIVIIVGEIPPNEDIGPEMRLYLRTNTYLCWGDKLFWKKLHFVLPDRERLQENVQQNPLIADDQL